MLAPFGSDVDPDVNCRKAISSSWGLYSEATSTLALDDFFLSFFLSVATQGMGKAA